MSLLAGSAADGTDRARMESCRRAVSLPAPDPAAKKASGCTPGKRAGRARYYRRRGSARLTDPALPTFSPARSGGRAFSVDEDTSAPCAGAKCGPATLEVPGAVQAEAGAVDGHRPADAEGRWCSCIQSIQPLSRSAPGRFAQDSIGSPPSNRTGLRAALGLVASTDPGRGSHCAACRSFWTTGVAHD